MAVVQNDIWVNAKCELTRGVAASKYLTLESLGGGGALAIIEP